MALARRKSSEPQPRLVGAVEQRSLPADPGLERMFLDIYLRIHDDAMDHALHFLDEQAAWDAVHEAIADILAKWKDLMPEQRSSAYFYGAIHKQVLMQLRQRKYDKRHVQLEEAEHQLSQLAIQSLNASIGEPQGGPDDGAVLDRIIGEMPPRRREVFILVRERGLSYKEAAEILGISVASVNTHLTLAYESVRAEMRRGSFSFAQPQQRKALPPARPEVSDD